MLPVQAGFDPVLLARIEDAGINASAPPQQRWMDGWLVRTSPGKAQRARCIIPVGLSRQPLAALLQQCRAVYREVGLPLKVRLTPFSQPTGIENMLCSLGLAREPEETCVMVRRASFPNELAPWPAGYVLSAVTAEVYAHTVGALRDSAPSQREAHAQRLRLSPVAYRGHVVQDTTGRTVACGQYAVENDLVGLYDVFVAPAQRGQGLAGALCANLLSLAAADGATTAYLQVEADNLPARRIYQRLGFTDAYGYHYLIDPDGH